MHLAAVAGGHLQGGDEEAIGFCSYCGRIGAVSQQRVCSDCGLGVRLRTDARALRAPGAAFLIVLADGTVSAASAAAERALGGVEPLAGRPVLALLAARDAGTNLATAVALAAAGGGGVVALGVDRLEGNRRSGALEVTIAPCGDPQAALLVLERPRIAP